MCTAGTTRTEKLEAMFFFKKISKSKNGGGRKPK